MRDLLVDGEGVGLPHLPRDPGPRPRGRHHRPGRRPARRPARRPPAERVALRRPARAATRRARHRCTGEDLDELAEAYDGYVGPLKVQVAGPWTLAASLRLNRGERVVADPGAVADLVASLADGIAGLRLRRAAARARCRGRAPGRRAVAARPCSRGRCRRRRASAGCARSTPRSSCAGIESVLAAHDGPTVVHCCSAVGAAAAAPGHRCRGARDRPHGGHARALGVGRGHPRRRHRGLGRVPADRRLAAPTAAPGRSCSRGSSARGWAADALRGLVVSPTCGLAGLTPEGARSVLRTALDTARRLGEEVAS